MHPELYMLVKTNEAHTVTRSCLKRPYEKTETLTGSEPHPGLNPTQSQCKSVAEEKRQHNARCRLGAHVFLYFIELEMKV